MKKNYFLLFLVVFSVALSASAMESKYYWHYVAAEAYPKGKGTVYVSNEDVDASKFAEYSETKFIEMYTPRTTSFYSNPAEGYQTVGWSFIDPVTFEVADTLISFDQNPKFSVSAKTDSEDDGSSTGTDYFPIVPDTTFVAVFGKVNFSFIPGQERALGTVAIDKKANDVGDDVTITAIPADERCRFAYWTDEQGNKVTENPYKFTVTGNKTYTPMFECDSAVTLTFPEEGGFIPYCESRYVTRIPDGVSLMCDFNYESWEEGRDYIVPATSVYQITHDWACLLYGKGTLTLVYDPDTSLDGENTDSYMRYSGDEGTDVLDLPSNGVKYYVFDGKKSFKHITEGTIEPKQCYLAVPDSVGEEREIIPFLLPDEEADATGIQAVKVVDKKAEFKQGTFDLSGRKVALPGKGLYIVDGKKVYIKK